MPKGEPSINEENESGAFIRRLRDPGEVIGNESENQRHQNARQIFVEHN